MSTTPQGSDRPQKAGAFDIRNFIGSLLGIYGVVLLLTGFFGTDDEALARADDVNMNIWTGVGLIIASAVFIGWAKLRPVVVPPSTELDDDTDSPRAGHGH